MTHQMNYNFKYHGKHTIKKKNYWDQDVLQRHEFKQISISNEKDGHLYIFYGMQDGKWVAGFDIQRRINGSMTSVGCGGGGCYPSRKWGEYPSKEILLEEMAMYAIQNYFAQNPGMIKLIQERVNLIIGLFGCQCHPFSSWKTCVMFHERKFKPGDPVMHRCNRKKGKIVKDDKNGFYRVHLGTGVNQQLTTIHAANLFPLS